MSEKPRFNGFEEPKANYSKLPHQLIDALPLFGSKAELVVVLYILRHTWGYHDTEKKITLDEFQHGRKDRHGERLDNGVGMSRPSIITGLRDAEAHGFIAVFTDQGDKGRVKKFYTLVSDGLKSFTPEVKEFNPSGKRTLPRSEKDTEERNQKKKTKDLSAASAEAPTPDKPRNEFYDVVKEVFGMEGALNGLMAGMLQGTATRKGWKECNLTPPVTIPELKAWASWFKQHNPTYMEVRPLYVQSSILAYRANPPKKQVVVPDTPLPAVSVDTPPDDSDARIPVSRSHIQLLKANGVLPADFDDTLQLTPAEITRYIVTGGKK